VSAPASFTVELEAVTPIFMSGADQAGVAELRPASLKGLLRYWYRTIDPDYARTEPALFGAARAPFGQAPFLIVVPGRLVGGVKWDADAYRRFASRAGNVWRNGVTYLGFSLGDRRVAGRRLESRKAIGAGTPITVVHYLARRATQDDRILKGLCASWWLLCHVGGLGSRSRRGFGTVALRRWTVDPPDWPSGMPPLPYESRDCQGWWRAFEEGLKALRTWYPGPSGSAPDHAVLDRRARFLLVKRAQARTWEEGLNEAGLLLQAYRQKRHDYPAVVEHLAHRAGRGGRPLPGAPKRSAFGLPLPVFSQSLRKAGANPFKTVFHGAEHGRSASRLWVRLVRADGAHHPMFARLSGPLLPPGERIVDAEHLDDHGNPVSTWPAPGDGVLEGFLDEVASKEARNMSELKGV
jgi:CRISPR-associated protein Cmr1